MADDTEERQLDEFGFPIPTPEELAAERAKTDQVIRLSGAAQALENQLPSASPSQTTLRMPTSSGRMYLITPPGPVAYPPPYGMMFPKNPPYEDLSRSLEPESPVTSSEIPYEDLSRSLEPEQSVTSRDIPPPASLNLPVSSGRMYMGPSMTPEQEASFHALQSPVSQNLMPPPTPEDAAGAAARVAYAGRTFGGGGPYDPAMERFRAQQAIQSAVAKGMPISDAVRLYGQDLFGAGPKPMTPYQQAQVARWSKPASLTPYQEALINRWKQQDALKSVPTETVTEVIPATEGSPGSPAIPASKGFFGIGAHPAVPEVPPTPARGEQRITRKVPVKKASETKGKLTKDQAAIFLNRAGGDKAKARKMAVDAGYEL